MMNVTLEYTTMCIQKHARLFVINPDRSDRKHTDRDEPIKVK